ncbi:unnamed protein product [Toxocara canis]|uniref:Secreted protein n=1 Tax=Toxocara canis TaxID=6265 RepID=A0A183V2I1_TOXCA|nr:unnamed protein product [Toxocara canis]
MLTSSRAETSGTQTAIVQVFGANDTAHHKADRHFERRTHLLVAFARIVVHAHAPLRTPIPNATPVVEMNRFDFVSKMRTKAPLLFR